MKKEKCYVCGRAMEFDGLCHLCSLSAEKREAIRKEISKRATKKINNFMSKHFA